MSDGPKPPAPDGWTRRDLLIVGGGAAAFGGLGLGALILGGGGPSLEFRPLSRLPGYRALIQGPVGGAALSGIDAAPAALPDTPPQAALCAQLFPHRGAPGAVPVAVFTDHRCAVCRAVEPGLFAREAAGEIAVNLHFWPALGGPSVPMARAAEAARAQGAARWAEFHRLLMESRGAANRALLARLARQAGLDAARLLKDMGNPKVESSLAQAAGLARLFGFVGTPGFTIGRSAASGALSEPRFDALIRMEKAAGPPPGCAGA